MKTIKNIAIIFFIAFYNIAVGQPNAPTVSGTTPTNDQTPTWSWVTGGGGGAGSYRYGYAEGTWIEENVTATSFTPGSDLAAGTHTLYVQEKDASNNWSTSGSKAITIDISAPSVPSVTGTSPTSDQTPTWSWSTGGGDGAGSYRYGYSEGTWIAEDVVATSFTPGSNLAAGTHTLYVQERDAANNWSTSGSRAITIDITAPNAPTVSGTTPTNDQTPTWSWATGGGGGAGYYRYGYAVGTWIEEDVAATSFTPGSNLAAGTHTLYVQERDAVNNWSPSGSKAITIDISAPSAPSVTGTSPTSDQTPTWSWSTGGGDGAGSYRYGYSEGTWIAEDVVATSFTPGSNLAAGTHTLYVQERDAVNNWSPSGSKAITIDISAPSAPSVTGTSPTNDQTPTWSWSTGGGDGAGSYRYGYSEGTWIAEDVVATSFTPGSNLAAGTHTLYVQERDAVNNWSPSGSKAITIDISAPSAPSVTGTSPTNDQTPTWSWSTGGGDGAGSYRYGYSEGTWIAEDVVATSFTPGSNLAAGTHTLYVQERDAVNNWSPSGSLSITIDIISPNAPSVSGTTPTNNQKPTWSWLTGGGGGNGRYRYGYTVGTWIAEDVTSTSYTPGSNLAAGTHTLYVQERDDAGNWSTSGSLAIVIDITPPSAPTISGITSGTYNVDKTFTVTGEANATIEYTTDGSTWLPYSGTVTLSSDDTYNIKARQTDQAGNGPVATSSAITVIIDKTPPSAPNVTSTTPTKDQTPTWSWTSGGGGSDNYRYKLDDSDLSVGATTTTSNTYTATSLDEGEHTLYVQERDAAMNWSSTGSFKIVIDITTQTPLLVEPLSNEVSNSSVYIEFNLPENAKTGTVKLKFNCTNDSGFKDRVITFKPSFEIAGTHSTTLNGDKLTHLLDGVTLHPDVLSVTYGTDGPLLLDGGVFEVTIEYQDELGNSIVVGDAHTGFTYRVSPPTLDYVSITSNNSTPSLVGVGGKVFLSFIASDDLKDGTVVVTVAGNSATVNGSGKVWNANYTMKSTDSEGMTPFFTIDFKDLIDNSGATVFASTDATSVTFDKTKPVLSSVSVVSNLTPNTLAKQGSVITVSFISSEKVEGVSVILNGHSLTATESPANNWTATYTMQSSDTEGPVYVVIDSKDLSGNPSTQVVNNSVTYDKTNPSLTYVSIKSNNTTNTAFAKALDVVTLTFTSSEDIKTPAVNINSTPATVTGGPQNWTVTKTMGASETEDIVVFSIPVVDLAGNTTGTNVTTTTNASTVTVDRTPPSVNASNVTVPAGNYGIGNVVTVTVLSDNSIYTGQNITVHSYPSTIVNLGNNSYKVYYTIQSRHTNYSGTTLPVNIELKDQAGNVTPISTAIVQGGTLNINTKPTARITGTTTKCDYSWQKVPITFTFTGYKPYTLEYKRTNGFGTATFGPFVINQDTYTVEVAEGGTYALVSLTDTTTNVANTAIEDATVTINAVTTPSFNVTASPYKLGQSPDPLSTYVSPTGGTFWGEGVSNGIFYPSIVGESGKVKTVTTYYEYTNVKGCKDTVSYNITVGEGAYFSGFPTLNNFCKNTWAKKDTVKVINVGNYNPITGPVTYENFSITPSTAGWSVIGGNTHSVEINPQLMTSNTTFTLTYIYVENGIRDTISQAFNVVQVVNNFNINVLSSSYCKDDANIQLVDNTSTPVLGEGHFFGPTKGFSTISGSTSATFSPSVADVNQNLTISYYYSKDGCNSDTTKKDNIIVYPLPVIDFTVLKPNYNFNEKPIILTGIPANSGSYFTGDVIETIVGLDGKATLNPSRAISFGIDIPIAYTYTDVTTGCTSTKQQTTKVYKADSPINVVKADFSLEAVKSTYCYADTTLTLSCTPIIGGITKPGIFTSKKNAITTLTDNSALYSIKKVSEGIDTLSFSYDIDGTAYKIVKPVFVDSIGNVSIDLTDVNFCKYVTSAKIQGLHRSMFGYNSYSYTGNVNAFSFPPNANYATFYPNIESIGSYDITYTFTSDKGCSKSITNTVFVRPIPVVNFLIIKDCGSVGIDKEISFDNTTDPKGSVITKWLWDWNDNSTSSNEEPLTHKFSTIGTKVIRLTATTDYNCSVTAQNTITVGISPIADFAWDNDCQSANPIRFVDQSQNGPFKEWTWTFDGTTYPVKKDTVYYQLPNVGKYNVKLEARTNDDCITSITKEVIVQPYVKFSDLAGRPFSDDFESNGWSWYPKGNAYSSWECGTPSGEIINSASSGQRAWFTNVNLDNQKAENSKIVSSCFDFTGLQKPMIKIKIWSAPEPGRDGAVLQYSTDGGNLWKNLGDKNEGINWYTPGNIGSKPDNQSTGWSSDPVMTNWVTARHDLDALKGKTNVRFRIVYASDANAIKQFNGFAFDDVWIGERQQIVLDEYFTNSTLSSCIASNQYISTFEASNTLDVIPVHYHTGNPSGDPLYEYNSAGPSSRAFYYGVPQVPYVLSNGSISSTLNDAAAKTEFERLTDVETLKDPEIAISLNATRSNVSVDLTALKDLSGEDLVLNCAVVKKTIDVNGSIYHNVLRGFIPNPGGTSLSTSGWVAGEKKTESVAVNAEILAEFYNSILVVFVQNASTRKVYQTASFDLSPLTGVDRNNISNLIDLYPNPASNYLIVESAYDIQRIELIDLAGRVVNIYNPNQQRFTIPVENLEKGIYIVRGKTSKGDFIRKFVKQ